MKIAIGSDEDTLLTSFVKKELHRRGYETMEFGALLQDSSHLEKQWPNVAEQVALAVVSGICEQGLLFCFTGTGVSIAANKVRGSRAALCVDSETAKGARRWNDANILVMSLRITTESIAKEILDAWFSNKPDLDSETQSCLQHLNDIEYRQQSQN